MRVDTSKLPVGTRIKIISLIEGKSGWYAERDLLAGKIGTIVSYGGRDRHVLLEEAIRPNWARVAEPVSDPCIRGAEVEILSDPDGNYSYEEAKI